MSSIYCGAIFACRSHPILRPDAVLALASSPGTSDSRPKTNSFLAVPKNPTTGPRSDIGKAISSLYAQLDRSLPKDYIQMSIRAVLPLSAHRREEIRGVVAETTPRCSRSVYESSAPSLDVSPVCRRKGFKLAPDCESTAKSRQNRRLATTLR